MGPKPLGMSIHRIDNDGNYEPGNCKWATRWEQQNSRRFNHCISWAGETLTIAQWERRQGMKRGTLGMRLQHGWSVGKALLQPIQKRRCANHRVTWNGETLTVAEWTRRRGFERETLRSRLEHGWSVERAFLQPVQQRSCISQKILSGWARELGLSRTSPVSAQNIITAIRLRDTQPTMP